jgi:hypothetical protein
VAQFLLVSSRLQRLPAPEGADAGPASQSSKMQGLFAHPEQAEIAASAASS